MVAKKTTKKKSAKKPLNQRLINKLKGINHSVFAFQYQKHNCDIFLGKRFAIEQELKRETVLYESFQKEEISEEGLRDVYVAFVKRGQYPEPEKVPPNSWRKFKTPEEVMAFG